MNTKDKIRAELEKLSKDDLIKIIAEVANAFVVASVNSRIANAKGRYGLKSVKQDNVLSLSQQPKCEILSTRILRI